MRDDLKRMAEDEEPQKGLAVERLRAAWARRKWLAVLVFALPFVAALSVIFALPTFYRSTALVLVERQQVPEAFVPSTVTSELEARVSEFRRRYLGELPQQMQANLASLESLNTQLRLASDNLLRAAERRESLTALLAEAASSPQAFGGSPGAAAEPRTVRLTRLRQELASARARYTEEHPSVGRLKAELIATERESAEASAGGAGATAGLLNPYGLRLRETLSATESEMK